MTGRSASQGGWCQFTSKDATNSLPPLPFQTLSPIPCCRNSLWLGPDYLLPTHHSILSLKSYKKACCGCGILAVGLPTLKLMKLGNTELDVYCISQSSFLHTNMSSISFVLQFVKAIWNLLHFFFFNYFIGFLHNKG